MVFKVGVSTGLYYIAHPLELATVIKKIGYGLTRGVGIIEISGDMPHEIDYTEGREARHLAEKQGIDLLFHGSLTVPMCIPERSDWGDAHDHIQKSIRSAVNAGCKYVLFHACLHFWLELITFVGTKLTIVMGDHLGRFISEVLYEDKKLRKWFIKRMRELSEIHYPDVCILTEDEIAEVRSKGDIEARRWLEEEVRKRAEKEGIPIPADTPEKLRRLEDIRREVVVEAGRREAEILRTEVDNMVEKKLSNTDPKKRRWRVETYGRLLDAYKIMGNYLFFRKDPIWMEMARMYADVLDKYKLNYADPEWLDKAWEKADRENDKEFKVFYYSVIGAKFLEGHMKKALEWLNKEFIPKELAGKPDLQEIAKNLQITIEIPDARDPRYAGRYLLWHPKQLYAAIKTIRKTLNTNRIWMTPDFEHMATQGIDPIIEMERVLKLAPDLGRYVLSVHSNAPNPLHSHYPIELGDLTVYKLLWYLRRSGAGKDHTVYLIFERGGGEEPFRQAVDALKLMAKFLEKDSLPENLPLEFFGLEKTAFDVRRQEEIMRDHRFEPLKDLFEIPEEEWGLISQAATKRGKKEIFKKEELK